MLLAYAALGLASAALLYFLLRWFAAASARDLATVLKTFAAAFAALASTGLLLTGRFGLAVVTVVATAMALRALVLGRRGADPIGSADAPASQVETRLLAMTLDHATGEVAGRVRSGAFAGRDLAQMTLAELLELLGEAGRDDPRSVPLLESYLDRRAADWRARGTGGGAAPDPAPAEGAMDERTALEILGLPAGAGADEIRAAHRNLMARLHPDHGGSTYLASQINRAREYLLRHRT
jgi:hypothetical protein